MSKAGGGVWEPTRSGPPAQIIPLLCVWGEGALLPGKKAEPALGTALAPSGPTTWPQADIWGSMQYRNVWLPSLHPMQGSRKWGWQWLLELLGQPGKEQEILGPSRALPNPDSHILGIG